MTNYIEKLRQKLSHSITDETISFINKQPWKVADVNPETRAKIILDRMEKEMSTMKPISIIGLVDKETGQALTDVVDESIRVIANDCRDRPNVEGWRSTTIKILCRPGDSNVLVMETSVKETLPPDVHQNQDAHIVDGQVVIGKPYIQGRIIES